MFGPNKENCASVCQMWGGDWSPIYSRGVEYAGVLVWCYTVWYDFWTNFACCVGAIPVCVLLHNGQSEETYRQCFELARRTTNICPRVFMTDDSTAERNALRAVFPESRLLLCVFHRSQVCVLWGTVMCSKNREIIRSVAYTLCAW